MAVGVEAEKGARLHVIGAGAIKLVAFAAQLVIAFLGADRVDGVDMAEDQDARRHVVAGGGFTGGAYAS